MEVPTKGVDAAQTVRTVVEVLLTSDTSVAGAAQAVKAVHG